MSRMAENLPALRAALAGYPARRAAQASALAQLHGLLPDWRRLAEVEPQAMARFIAIAAKEEPGLALFLGGALFAHGGDAGYFRAAAAGCAAHPATAPERFEAFIWLNYLLTMHKAACGDAEYFTLRQHVLAPLYAGLFSSLSLPAGHLLRPTQKRALICAGHMNNPRHLAFAWDALETAHHLRADFGYDVLLLNGNFWLRGNALPVWPLQQFSVWTPPLRGDWPHRGGSIPYVTLPETQPTPANLQTAWDAATGFNPSLVLSIGDCNPYADMLARHRPAVTVHFTVDYPIVLHSMAGVNQDVPETAPALLAQLQSPTRQIALTPQHYSLPGRSHAYPRAALGLRAEDYVAVVIGHRLDSEVTPPFLEMLDGACAALPQLRVVFAGHFHHYDAKIASYAALRRQAMFIGHAADVSGLCACADIFVNPERTGGGSSAVYAMAQGLPVLTLARGDVAFAVGKAHCLADWPRLQRALLRFATDKSAQVQASQQARSRAAMLCDRRAQLANILGQLNRPFA